MPEAPRLQRRFLSVKGIRGETGGSSTPVRHDDALPLAPIHADGSRGRGLGVEGARGRLAESGRTCEFSGTRNVLSKKRKLPPAGERLVGEAR